MVESPWIFYLASGRQRNYAATCGGGGAHGRGPGCSLSALAHGRADCARRPGVNREYRDGRCRSLLVTLDTSAGRAKARSQHLIRSFLAPGQALAGHPRKRAVTNPPFRTGYFSSLRVAPGVARRRPGRVVPQCCALTLRHLFRIEGTAGIVPRWAARQALRPSAASACTASRRTL